MESTLDSLRRLIAHFQKTDPESPFLRDLKVQLGAYTDAPRETRESQWHSGKQAMPGSQTPPQPQNQCCSR